MKKIVLSLSVLLVLSGLVGSVRAEKADRNKPMNVESDALRYDDLKQVSIFTGNVILTKGSILIRGSQIEVRQDPEGYQFGLVTGSPDKQAFFRQKRDGIDEYIEGEGDTIEYDGKADTVRFIKKAQMRRLRGATLADEVTGAVILYENLTDRFTVDGAPKTAAAPAGRVRAMLTPKPERGTAAPIASGAELKVTPQIEKVGQ
ncbi:lipopolysaccharide transport periplasmic protein LptA [Rhodoferax sp. TBRC 17198]|uniref:lipopolysaccharide transport periplasmic protein LptA n=1 Tax=Rhodoferax potami TaxID=3068338 RepID=UPI0028BF2790|nr:lipopolysaccharide transport periplasmic protein LptA [Rhodoferax sp. TBRC 17198]MDT7523584.1 lipopolysaccharide transport periplasmic protein LptA [Rhodoferax sp. TBRC 17198]